MGEIPSSINVMIAIDLAPIVIFIALSSSGLKTRCADTPGEAIVAAASRGEPRPESLWAAILRIATGTIDCRYRGIP